MKTDIHEIERDIHMNDNVNKDTFSITEEKAMRGDIKTMSQDELMAIIEFLDNERNIIAQKTNKLTSDNDNNDGDETATFVA